MVVRCLLSSMFTRWIDVGVLIGLDVMFTCNKLFDLDTRSQVDKVEARHEVGRVSRAKAFDKQRLR